MKKITAILLIAIAIAGCNNTARQSSLQESNDSLKTALLQKDADMQALIATITTIEEGFKKINAMQGRITVGGPGSEISYSETLESDIAYITETLAKNKTEIERLKQELASKNRTSKEIKTLVGNLEKELGKKGDELAMLQRALAEKDIHISELDNIINELMQENTGQQLQLIAQEQELNKVWYAIGTKSELKEQNILKSGDVMRESDVNLKYFTAADKRELTTINTQARKAKLLTTHPDGSYALERNADKEYVLTITAPDLFWSVSRYLVIQVR